LLSAAFFTGCSTSSGNEKAQPSRSGLLISDIHFNPLSAQAIADSIALSPASEWDGIFAGSGQKTCATYMNDTNFVLLDSAIDAMKAEVPDPDVIIMSGDMMVHYFLEYFYNRLVTNPTEAGYRSLVNQTEQYIAMKLTAAFPDAQILPVLGDWDSDMGVVSTPASSAFLTSFATAWNSAVNKNNSAPDFISTFSSGGYYEARIPISPNIRLLGLYSVPWAQECTTGCSTIGDAELNWLGEQLADAEQKGEKVWLLGHLPPGIDANTTADNVSKGQSCEDAVTPFWSETYSSQLYPLFAQYKGTIGFGVFAHEHYDDFRIVNDNLSNFIFGVKLPPSITPLHNNPAFISFDYDPAEGVMTDASTFYLSNLASNPTRDTAVWEFEYSFDSLYAQNAFDSNGLLNAVCQIIVQPGAQKSYVDYYPVLYPAGNILPGGLIPFLGWSCALNNLTVEGYTNCCCQ
jgi:hypothetical protein